MENQRIRQQLELSSQKRLVAQALFSEDNCNSANYCPDCNSQSAENAIFCDQCGHPLITPYAVPITYSSQSNQLDNIASVSKRNPDASFNSSPLTWITQRWMAPCAALASVLVLALGFVVKEASAPPPSAKEILASLQNDNVSRYAPYFDLLCLRNFPYHRHHIQIYANDQVARDWLDLFVKAGLYAAPVEVISEGMSSETTISLLQYQVLPAINAWRHNGRLCVAQRWVLDSIVPESIRKDARIEASQYIVSLVWRAEGVAPWFESLRNFADLRLIGVNFSNARKITVSTQQMIEKDGEHWRLIK